MQDRSTSDMRTMSYSALQHSATERAYSRISRWRSPVRNSIPCNDTSHGERKSRATQDYILTNIFTNIPTKVFTQIAAFTTHLSAILHSRRDETLRRLR